MKYKLLDLLTEYKETNKDSLYEPVAVGKYGIRKRNEIYKKELSDDYSKNKVIRNNTLIVGMGSSQIDIGVLSEDEIYSVSPAYHTYRINIQVVSSDYLDLLFKANNANYFKKYSIATARQGKKIDLKSLLNEMVDIPSFEKQGIIVGKIFDINELIRIEEKSLSLLEELTKSRFKEMFLSRKGLPKRKWADVLTIYNGRDYKKNVSNETEGFPVYGSGGFMGVYADRFICEGTLIIIGRKGTIDRPILVKGKIWNIDTAFGIKTDSKVLNPVFFYYRSKFYDYKGMNKQTTKPSLTKSDLLKLDIELPSMNEQRTFVDFVEQIDKLKFNVQQRIEKYKELLNKKMSEYFN